jgi:hypothetical protein
MNDSHPMWEGGKVRVVGLVYDIAYDAFWAIYSDGTTKLFRHSKQLDAAASAYLGALREIVEALKAAREAEVPPLHVPYAQRAS